MTQVTLTQVTKVNKNEEVFSFIGDNGAWINFLVTYHPETEEDRTYAIVDSNKLTEEQSNKVFNDFSVAMAYCEYTADPKLGFALEA